MRPIDFCTPKPFQLEHSCFAVSQRDDRPVKCLSARREGHPRPGALRLRARSRERLISRATPRVRRRGELHTGRLGAARCERGRGESRFTARFPLRRPGDSLAVASSSAAWESIADRLWHPCRLLLAAARVAFLRPMGSGSEAAKTGSAGAS